MKTETLTGSDAQHGYRFGESGTKSITDAADFLGVSRWTIDRLVDRGHLRRGKDPETGSVLICRRSISEYLKSIQE